MTKMIKHLLVIFSFLSLFFLASGTSVAQNTQTPKPSVRTEQIAPSADHHQHVFSPAHAEFSKGKTLSAQDIIGLLDDAGIRRAVLLSVAFQFGRPGREPQDEYAKVKAENDWTGAQAALFPDRLRAFCSVNPLKDYALDELVRCSKDPNLRHGLKLHFGNSDVQLEKPDHVEKLKRVFSEANSRRMAIVVHMRASFSLKRPYGAEQARIFLDELLPLTPDIPVQIAHFTSSGPGYDDPPAHSAIAVFAEAVAKKDPRTRRLWFDLATNAYPENTAEINALLVRLIRRIGVKRILYGSDAAVGTNLRPREGWEAFSRLALTKKELKTIAKNVAPYLR